MACRSSDIQSQTAIVCWCSKFERWKIFPNTPPHDWPNLTGKMLNYALIFCRLLINDDLRPPTLAILSAPLEDTYHLIYRMGQLRAEAYTFPRAPHRSP
jgi:hypothetical protein